MNYTKLTASYSLNLELRMFDTHSNITVHTNSTFTVMYSIVFNVGAP